MSEVNWRIFRTQRTLPSDTINIDDVSYYQTSVQDYGNMYSEFKRHLGLFEHNESLRCESHLVRRLVHGQQLFAVQQFGLEEQVAESLLRPAAELGAKIAGLWAESTCTVGEVVRGGDRR